jgi:hypothetical protein
MGEYHALASPSSAHRVLNCANALAMEKGQPDSGSKAADLGNDKHELLSMCMGFNANAETYLGHVLKKGHTVDKSFAADVQTVVQNVRDRIANYEAQGCTVAIEIEQDVPVSQITGEQDATGRADIVLIISWPDGHATMDVIDAKFGYQEVEAENNPQLMMYGHGSLQKFGLVEDFTEISLVIEQPLRAGNEWRLTVNYLEHFVAEARPQFEKAILIHKMVGERALKEEDFAPSEKTCMWCKAKAVCPALLAKVEETIGVDFETIADNDHIPAVEIMTVDRLGSIFPSLELIEDWIKAVRARIELEMFAGRKVPGVKVVAGKRGNRAWSNDDQAEEMMKGFRLKLEQMYSFKLLGPKPILEALKDQPRRLKKIEALIVQPEGKPHVVLDSDKRPAIEIKPVEDGFETVDDSEDIDSLC